MMNVSFDMINKNSIKRLSAHIFWVLSFIVIFPLTTNAAKDKADRAAKDPVNIVFIGNSITYGATLSDAGSQCPPKRVSEFLADRGYTVNYRNCAISGYTTFHFIPSGSQHGAVVNAVKELDKKPGKLFVLIMLGTNDSAERGPLGAPVNTDTYYKNMKSIIDDIYQYSNKAIVIVNYPIWYSPNTHNFSTYMQAGLDRLGSYYPVIDSLVKYYKTQTSHKVYAGSKAPYVFFQNNNKYLTPENGQSGTFYLHPNLEGAKKLATFWTNSILKILGDKEIKDPVLKPYLHKKPKTNK